MDTASPFASAGQAVGDAAKTVGDTFGARPGPRPTAGAPMGCRRVLPLRSAGGRPTRGACHSARTTLRRDADHSDGRAGRRDRYRPGPPAAPAGGPA